MAQIFNEVVEKEIAVEEKKSGMKEWLKFIISLVMVFLIVSNSVGLTKVMGNSMEPTLKDGSLLLINKLSTIFSKPSFGDVVIVDEGGYQIVKRVIGVPGDTVAIQGGNLYINDILIPEVYELGTPNDMAPVTVGEGEIFIMGDNRTPGESLDSRDPNMGPISEGLVDGYAAVSLFPFYKIMKPLDL